ncbi:hypothetical protein ANCCAN_22132 [Ancylostoma caninum]|uniref:Uncharacterized protein n=1 Tax=Ancylostoma caninum TaxID=29170 RepID=A0A368FIT3_ANCCA|nr:hypothetical protein ANCCAN_22132 [Ancylostoma caninum]
MHCSSRDVMTTKTKAPPPLSKIYYVDLVLIGLTVILGTIGLLFPKVPLLIWLPSLLLLCSSCVSLSALIYLNKRIFCVCLLLIGIFVPHAIVWISGSLATVAQIHAVFGLIAVGKVTFFRLGLDKRNTWKDAKCASHRIEEIAIVNLSASRSTLVTNIDEGELVHFDSP